VVDEICNNPYASMNFTLLEEKLKNEVYGQPFITSESFLKDLKSFYHKSEIENPLILSFNGGTGMFIMN
jgi:hypothetical protein